MRKKIKLVNSVKPYPEYRMKKISHPRFVEGIVRIIYEHRTKSLVETAYAIGDFLGMPRVGEI